MAKNPRILASSVLITKLAEHGLESTRLWHIPGPANTQIVWISAYNVNGVVVIVQTLAEGWEVYTPGQSNKIDDTVADVIARVTPGALAAAVMAERERIAAALDYEAEMTPDAEDAAVVSDCAWLVRADFSYDEAERLQTEAETKTEAKDQPTT